MANNLEKDITFRGQKAVLATSLLESDYKNVNILLRAYANLMNKNIKMYRKVLPDSPHNNSLINTQISKIKQARLLARRFAQRAERIRLYVKKPSRTVGKVFVPPFR